MIELTLIGKVEEAGFGVACDYELGNIFLMNNFLRYIIQNEGAISDKLMGDYTKETIEKFQQNLINLDEFETCMFLNLDFIDAKDIENRYFLKVQNNCVYLKNEKFQIKCRFPIIINLLHESNDLNIEKIKDYNDKIVEIIINEFPIILMREDQIKKNLIFLIQIIDNILLPFNLSSKSEKSKILRIFNLQED
jgi:hypothetical protein